MKYLALPLGFLLAFIVIPNNAIAEDGLVGWWKFDGNANDSSGLGHDGKMVGDATIAIDAQRGQVLQLSTISNNTTNNWVDCGGGGVNGWANLKTVSISAWVKIARFVCSREIIACKGLSYMVSRFGSTADTDHLRFWTDGFNASGHHDELEGRTDIQDNKWHHVVFVYDGATGARYLYVDAQIDIYGSYLVDLADYTNNFVIGGSASYTGRCWKGLIDDVRLYNIALSQNQIRDLYGGPYSMDPTPPDTTGNLPVTTTLSWQPNQIARPTQGRDIYFGTNYYDVSNGIPAVHVGLQDGTNYNPGTLKSGTTYYWRVDEIDSANNTNAGYIWSFRTETQGYYMDLFKDSGIGLNATTEMPAASLLALSYESFAAIPDLTTNQLQIIQNSLVVGSTNDDNGIYLYPDGQPRFRCIYVSGGEAGSHGTSYGTVGRQNINQFFDSGGSYSGSCAGAFLCSLGVGGSKNGNYFQMWPASTKQQDGIFLINYTIPANSPLLNYYDFGGELVISNVQHWNGPYVISTNAIYWAAGSEVLGRYDSNSKSNCAGQVGLWAWKGSANTGRLVPSGSHPERVPVGNQRDYMAGILRYAMDGNGQPQVKAVLQKGVPRLMNNNAATGFEKIGDKQYHHFTIQIPPTGTNNLIITLTGDGQHDLNLYARCGSFAFEGEGGVLEAENNSSSSETLEIKHPQSGTWYIGVKGVQTVDRTLAAWGWAYSGHTELLNGVPYTIVVDDEPPAVPPVVQSFTPAAPGVFNLTCSAETNRTYILQTTASLVGGNWIPVSTNIAPADTLTISNIASSDPARFYRLLVVP